MVIQDSEVRSSNASLFTQTWILYSSLILPELYGTLRNTLSRSAAKGIPEIAISFPGFCLLGLPSGVIISVSQIDVIWQHS